LFELLRKITSGNKITSIHFMESEDEMDFLETHSGNIMDSYRASGLVPAVIQTAKDHLKAVLDEVTSSGNLILVHNTFVKKNIIHGLMQRKDLFWCLCPNSNIYIETCIPPATLLSSEGCTITVGTDSLASNSGLSIISELITLQYHFPGLSLEEMIRWATINGAMALCMDDTYGSIEPGKRPGLLLLENIDIANLRLLPSTTVKRLL
jgi:cytosine/adenosine deaminase-related metal-dependent hydrolase